MQIAVTNYWGHQGCIFLYDSDGKPLWEMQNEMNGNIIAPVNWDGDGAELWVFSPRYYGETEAIPAGGHMDFDLDGYRHLLVEEVRFGSG